MAETVAMPNFIALINSFIALINSFILGKVHAVTLFRFTLKQIIENLFSQHCLTNDIHLIKCLNKTEFNKLPGTCHVSFYECLKRACLYPSSSYWKVHKCNCLIFSSCPQHLCTNCWQTWLTSFATLAALQEKKGLLCHNVYSDPKTTFADRVTCWHLALGC